jgi:hypothetical protein
MEPRRPPIYLLTGLIIGLALGLLYAWVLTPPEALETSPVMLRTDFKDTYREMIARAYLSNGDLGRAQARLALLDDEDPVRALAVQAQLTLGQGENSPARALGLLAAALQAQNEGNPISETGAQLSTPTQLAVALSSKTPTLEPGITPSATPTATASSGDSDTEDTPAISPTASITPTATPTATATPGPPFVLEEFFVDCNPDIDPPQIQVFVRDAAGNPVPGVAFLISWDGFTNRFITGLHPTYGLGYADFDMDPAVTYSLRLENGGDPINSITAQLCEDGPEPFYGSWRFNFIQP